MIARVLDDTDSDRPPLVYVPGVDGTGEFLFGTRASLAQRFRLLRLCYVPGEKDGGPERELAGDGYADLAASVAECLRERGVERALFLAESFGVGLALRIALDHPPLVRGLMLVNGFCYYENRLRLALSETFLRVLPTALFRFGRRYFALVALVGPRKDADVKRAFHALEDRGFDDGYRRRMKMIARLDLRSRLHEIEPPVALFASDRDRIVRSVRAARLMERELPNAKLEILENAGHVVLPLASEPWVERLDALDAACSATPRTSPAS